MTTVVCLYDVTLAVGTRPKKTKRNMTQENILKTDSKRAQFSE